MMAKRHSLWFFVCLFIASAIYDYLETNCAPYDPTSSAFLYMVDKLLAFIMSFGAAMMAFSIVVLYDE